MAATTADAALNEFLEARWWALALRGLVGIVFGIICVASPAIAAFSMLLVFGAFSFADGMLGLAAAFGQARRGERWVWLAIEAVASIVIGLLVLITPGVSIVVLFLIIAIKTALTGMFLLLASIKLDGEHGQGWLATTGVLTSLFAAVLFMAPLLGAKILVWWVGAWAILFGAMLIGLAFKLRSVRNRLSRR
jgi:uncharacterized membrane protein HdeD (DUF308 family)